MFRVGNPGGDRGGRGRCDNGSGGLSSGVRARGVVLLTRMLPGRVELKRSESKFVCNYISLSMIIQVLKSWQNCQDLIQ
jgi:hypothetical protein